MEAPISASQGAMRSLPGKLESLLSDPDKALHKGEKNKIRALKGDLEELIAKYLVEPSEVEDPALTASSWMKEARELSYDIHDFIDELVSVNTHAKIQQGPRPQIPQQGPRPQIPRLQEKRNRHQEITEQISSFRARVKEAIQQHKDHLCNLRKWPSTSSSAAALDGRLAPLPPPLDGGLRLVGMGSSIQELSGWLAKDGMPERRVVSIVGVGGVGKSTLANQLYSKLGGQFQCRAFVRTTRKPDHRRLLTSILSQVRPHHPLHPSGVPNLVEMIKEYLQNKTYFIIIDDLWAPSTWDIVSRALPKGNYCTRILITTEVEVVARICCAGNSKYIYKKNPLSEDEANELFSNVIFVHQSDQCSNNLSELHKEIIKKNGGLPLAIIIMASLLARQPASIEQWNYMLSLPSSYLVKNANLEMMRHVLNLSYNCVPHYLKACMLYLSLYEENSIILKDDLVKQWISEDFVCAMEGNDKEKVAQGYFDELVNRGMIQPVDIDSSDEVMSCTVHYMVLHHIRIISIEENFNLAIDHSQTATRLADKVRRLALHFGTEEDAKPPTTMRLSQVRSLAFFGLVRCMPSVMQFQFLRVLIVKLWVDPDETSYCNLSGISELFQLRYLRVDACHVKVELPTRMGWLKDLVAFQIEAKVTAVPSDIVSMAGLLYLNLPSEARLPTGIGNMTSLRTLGYFDLSSNSEENVMDLGKLTNLQGLHLTCSAVQPADNLKKTMECLGLVLEKLSNLKCVTLVPAVLSDVNTHDGTGASSSINISCNVLSSISPASTYLQRFELFPRFCIFHNLPKWFGELHQLCILKIAIKVISTEDICILKALPALTALSLSVWTAPEGWIFIEADGFLALRYFKFTCAAPCLYFVEGAMSDVQRLKMGFNANRLEKYSPADAGYENLFGLKEISMEIGGVGADKLDLTVLESALLTSFKKERRRTLVINLQWVHWIYHGDREMSTSLQKKNYQTLPVKGVPTEEQHGWTSMPLESISRPQNPGTNLDDFTHKTNEAIIAVHEEASEVDYSFNGGENKKQKHQLDNIVEELDEYYKPVETPQDEPDGSYEQQSDKIVEEEQDGSYNQPPDTIVEEERDDYDIQKQDRSVEGKPNECDKALEIVAGKRSPESLLVFTLDELISATSNFSRKNLLGECGPATMYRGTVDGKLMVTMAKFTYGIWLTKLQPLNTRRHPHLVRLLGYHHHGLNSILVYEDMSRGSLKYLFETYHIDSLCWLTRLKIAVGAAKGLAFVHESGKSIVDNFSACSILVDSEYTAKLWGFDMHRERNYSVKDEVFNFGMVLLELLSGCPWEDGSEQISALWSPVLLSEEKLHRIMDPRLGGQFSFPAAWIAVKIARLCLDSRLVDMPMSMHVVAQALERLLSDHTIGGRLRASGKRRSKKSNLMLQCFISRKAGATEREEDKVDYVKLQDELVG